MSNTDIGTLPEWDLADLYPATDSDALEADLTTAAAKAEAFEAAYAGKLGSLGGEALGAAIAEYEVIDGLLGRIMSYAGLVHAGAMDDPEIGRFYQTMQERVTDISARVLFFTLELNNLDDAALATMMKAPAAAKNAPWVRDQRAFRPYQLSHELERLLHEKSVAGRAAWTRLFEQTMDALRFPMDGRELTSAEVLHLLADHDGAVRERAAQSLARVLGANARTFALIFNTLIKDKGIEDQWRGLARPISSRNLSNQVEDEVVDALIGAVKQAYPRLSHRYYAIKAKWFGVETLDYWDRNAPLPDENDRVIPWSDARDTVIAAYGAFSPEMADLGRRFFDNPWIDAPVRPGKAPGAFS
ncbi:MAG: oligoendopeptidase F, partial [Alphaproteobacteria bacterium]